MTQNDIPLGFYPFWFWNDDLSAGEIRWQVGEMAAQGVRGFFIHPRQGLERPYLSESFFQMVDAAVEAADEHGLVVHLYDEYPYPSGIAGGAVTLGCPQYHATQLVQKSYDLDGGPVRLGLPRGKLLCCTAYPLQGEAVDWDRGIDLRDHIGMVLERESYVEMGLTKYNRKRYFASEPTPVLEATLPRGPHKLFVAAQVEVNHFKYWDHYVDTLNPEAVARFITLTHERYRQRYAERFGQRIVSIFVDETAPWWSERIPAAFQAEHGYDLLAALPALQDSTHPDHVRVAYDLQRLTYRLFCQSFEGQISGWCREHGLAYSGEKPSLRLAQLKYMDIPGCEPGHTKVGAKPDWLRARVRANARATASAAYFFGKPGALCECYHSLGWSATLQDAKSIADGLLLAGIRYLVPHGFFYSTHALKKHDAPPTFFFQMPFWPLFGVLSGYVERIGKLFESTHVDAQILLVDPGSGVPAHAELTAYETILWLLAEQHLDFHIVDTEILTSGQIGAGCVQIADIAAKVVIVPPMRVIEEPLQTWLEAFEAAGGTVARCACDLETATLTAELLKTVQPSLRIQAGGQEATQIVSVKRVSEDGTIWFLVNLGGESLTVQFESGGDLREVPLDETRPTRLEKKDGRYQRLIWPFESLALEAADAAAVPEPIPQITVPVGGSARVRAENANLLRLGKWRMALQNQDGGWGQSALVRAIPIANQLEEGAIPFVPAYRKHFGHEPELSLPELHARYEVTFGCDYDGAVQLVMEPGSIVGDWHVSVNGSGPLGPADFRPTAAHVRGSLGADVTDWLVRGENVIRVEVITDRTDGGLLNPLYLAGDFGVRLNPVRIVARGEKGAFEEYEANLLPHYAGVIEYTTTFTLDQLPSAEHALVAFDYGKPFHESSEVSVNDGPYQPVLWQPRCVALERVRLRVGENTLKTRVYTTLIRSFEGQRFDYALHEYQDVG
ncbi:MAG: hypothetical protein JW918_08975 [Anaerolineae bacterium]|nr:hypothetical protein [Anaerolineae bacterium]